MKTLLSTLYAVAVSAINNNSGSIATGDAVLQERVAMLERLLEEKERLIKVLMGK